MNVEEIIEKYLRDNGFTALCDPENECGCIVESLMPCIEACPNQGCVPGYYIGDDTFSLVEPKELIRKEREDDTGRG